MWLWAFYFCCHSIATVLPQAYKYIFEIGRRLKHVKENDLAHGEFWKWLEKVGMSKTSAKRFMKIAENPTLNSPTSDHLGASVLYEIATLPEPERTKEHTT